MEIIAVISLVLNVIALGLIFWLRKDQKTTNKLVEIDIEQAKKAYNALMKDFTNYQVSEKRLQEKSVARMEIRHDNIARSIKKNEEYISYMKKSLPEQIRDVIGHIEFARPLDKK